VADPYAVIHRCEVVIGNVVRRRIGRVFGGGGPLDERIEPGQELLGRLRPLTRGVKFAGCVERRVFDLVRQFDQGQYAGLLSALFADVGVGLNATRQALGNVQSGAGRIAVKGSSTGNLCSIQIVSW
jgi:hypothetical protein